MNAKLIRRPLSLSTLAPFAIVALVAQGCGGLGPVKSKAGSGNKSETTGSPSSSPAATGSEKAEETGSGEEGSGDESVETGSEETGSQETGSGEKSSEETGSEETGSEEETKSTDEEKTNTDDKTTSTKEEETTSDKETTSKEETSSTDETTTEEEDPAPDETGDDKIELTWLDTGLENTVFIGMDVRTSRNLWLGGSQSTILHSTDAGETWKRVLLTDNPKDSKLQVRDFEIVNLTTMYALTAGDGEKSRIFKTTDAGRTWKEQYKARNEKASIKCMDFWDANNGIVFGDSMGSEHFILRTSNGMTWDRIDGSIMPAAQDGERGFSASGSCGIAQTPNTFMIATAGAEKPRILKTTDRGNTWEAYDVPMLSKAKKVEDRGITSLVMWSDTEGLAFGTDLNPDAEKVEEAVAYTKDGGKTWELRDFEAPNMGVFSAASNSDGSLVILVGRRGMHYSTDKGVTWTEISRRDLWTIKFADDKTAFAAGTKGTVVRIKVK